MAHRRDLYAERSERAVAPFTLGEPSCTVAGFT